jgi:hypothetical protein
LGSARMKPLTKLTPGLGRHGVGLPGLIYFTRQSRSPGPNAIIFR